MTSPRWPDVYGALLVLLPTLPGWSGVAVFDGQPITEDAVTDYITVGYAGADPAGAWRQSWDPGGSGTEEVGEIRCQLVSQSGDTPPTATRARAYALVGAFQAALYADQTFGGLLERNTVVTLGADVDQVQNGNGSAQSLLLTVSYQTVTFF